MPTEMQAELWNPSGQVVDAKAEGEKRESESDPADHEKTEFTVSVQVQKAVSSLP